MWFDFNIRANLSQYFCFYDSYFIKPNSWEAMQDKQCSTENVFPLTQRERTSFSGQLYRKHNVSLNAALLRQKPCSSNGNVVNQFDAPLWNETMRKHCKNRSVDVSQRCEINSLTHLSIHPTF